MKICFICGSSENVNKNRKLKKYLCNRHKMQLYKYGEILERTKYDKNEITRFKTHSELAIYDLNNIEKCRVIIDHDDEQLVSSYKWHLNAVNGYIESIVKNKNIKIHRLIMNPEDIQQVDHINGNKLDNQRINLRLVNNTQNSLNSKVYSNNKSGYSGVYWNKQRENWVAQITVEGKKIRLGGFKNLMDAVHVRKEAEKKYYAEYAPEKRKGEGFAL